MTLIKDANMKFDLFAYRADDANNTNGSDFILTVTNSWTTILFMLKT